MQMQGSHYMRSKNCTKLFPFSIQADKQCQTDADCSPLFCDDVKLQYSCWYNDVTEKMKFVGRVKGREVESALHVCRI